MNYTGRSKGSDSQDVNTIGWFGLDNLKNVVWPIT